MGSKPAEQQIIVKLVGLIEKEWGILFETTPTGFTKLESLSFWNSLNAVILLALIEHEFDVEIPISIVRGSATFGEIAEKINELSKAD